MPTPQILTVGAPLQVVNNGSGLNSGSVLLTSAFNNATGQTLAGYPMGVMKLVFTMTSAPLAGTSIRVYKILPRDPTSDANYEDATTPPTWKIPLVEFGLDTSKTSYDMTQDILLPGGYFKLLFHNAGTGQALAANWNCWVAPSTWSF